MKFVLKLLLFITISGLGQAANAGRQQAALKHRPVQDFSDYGQTLLQQKFRPLKLQKLECTLVNTIKGATLALSDYEVTVKDSLNSRIPVLFHSAEHHFVLWFKCRGWKQVLQNRYELKTHERIDAQQVDTIIRELPLTTKTLDHLPHNIRAKRPLALASILTEENTESLPLVNTGQMVTVHVRQNSIHLIDSGQALKDGAFNSTIPIKNLSSQKVFTARVVGESEVEVLL